MRLLADPWEPLRENPPPPNIEPGIDISAEMAALAIVGGALSTPPSRPTSSDSNWRALMWGEHIETSASAGSYNHVLRLDRFADAVRVVDLAEKITPDPLLIDVSAMSDDDMKRMVDFLAGVTYARFGQIARVSTHEFAVSIDRTAAPRRSTSQVEELPLGQPIESAG